MHREKSMKIEENLCKYTLHNVDMKQMSGGDMTL